MHTITLEGLLPKVFAHQTDLVSEVWSQTLSLKRGDHYLLSAGSGAGKSSLCSFIYGLRKDYLGRILFDAIDVSRWNYNQWSAIRRTSLAFLPQDLRLFKDLTCIENVLLKNRLTRAYSRQEIESWFELLGIADKRNTVVDQLSLGEQQRVAIIRTLCQKADFYILDEPVSHLDPINNKLVATLFESKVHSEGSSLLVTSVGYPLEFLFTYTLQL
ncbi:ATP-binding cassette domain-containing protein [Porphyromonas circumdentaria]|uniref:ABC-type lipoprotein export system, ATPase component n=1 Tax=Porphyromonas circumdentaria TaxID=29524 RepID=A0A1T4N9X9_9PORP|nr:ATP-binding cassette domain-containing protein [Porphyromonas circumdentaria]MDO4722779.1 ATP-binding cassette domain-containing protein [Porphyromonas circumdentaria]SJZ75873.1 ABC-type lipoprotein export system, ATPase component [Porphyromonas circumdentaria]